MSAIFGGSQSQSQNTSQSNSNALSQSYNQAYPTLANALGGNVTNGSNAGNQLANLLGLNGSTGQNQGFQNWQNSTGYQFGLGQGLQSINGNAAASGLLNSGATGKALETYGQNYANTQYGNYFNQLSGLLTGGNQSGSVIGSAGNVSNSAATSNSQSQGTSSSSSMNNPFGSAGGAGQIASTVGDLLLK